MGNHVNVTNTGGNAAIGNLVQGDHNVVQSGDVAISSADRFRDLKARLPALARPFDRPDAEVARLRQHIDELEQALASGRDARRGGGVLKTILDKFSWAWPAVKEVVSATWPTLLTAVIGAL